MQFPKPFIITVGNTKGGSGKSTVAYQLSEFLAKMLKYWVLLVDADSQHSLERTISTVHERGEDANFHYIMDTHPGKDGSPLGDHLENIPDSSRYDFIVVDTPPRLDCPASVWAYTNANVFIIPIPGALCDDEDYTATLVRSAELNPNALRIALPVSLHSFLCKEEKTTVLQRDYHKFIDNLRGAGIAVAGDEEIWPDFNVSFLQLKCRSVYSKRADEGRTYEATTKFVKKTERCMAAIMELVAKKFEGLPADRGNAKLSSKG